MRLARVAVLVGLVGSAISPACGEGLPDVPLKLSKNCNEVEVVSLVPRVGQAGEEVVDVSADGTLGDTAWVLLRRSSPDGSRAWVVQQVSVRGVEHEVVIAADDATSLLLSPAPETGRVWVVRDEPGIYQVWRVAPDDPIRPLLGSTDLASFPSAAPPCDGCVEDWPRRLFFLPTGPAIVSLPRASEDANLVVYVAELSTSGPQIVLAAQHELNFPPPCDDSTPESEQFCEEQAMMLRYPEISILGVQQDPRQAVTALFAHRTRSQSYDGEPFPLQSADVLMVDLDLDDMGQPAGMLRSYSASYVGDRVDALFPTAEPPYGMAIDRFASYGLFSHGEGLSRLVQLPAADPEFVELTDRVSLACESCTISLLQLDLDVALGRLVDGAWHLTKLFPDDPSQSGELTYESDAPLTEVASGGLGTFMLRKQGAPPEVVRLRCPEPDVAIDQDG
jgi:hypothetical protein